jgi:hypothetical protein
VSQDARLPATRPAVWVFARPPLSAAGAVGGQRLNTPLGNLDYRLCPGCRRRIPKPLQRCSSRRCPAFAAIWARDTLRKVSTNLDWYGGRIAMITLTAPGVESVGPCVLHDGPHKFNGPLGCRHDLKAVAIFNEFSRQEWRTLNRVCKQRADRKLKRLGHSGRGGILTYQWELHQRGVWHLHIVLGMELGLEVAWGMEYAAALRSLSRRYGFGHVDTKPLGRPTPVGVAALYLAKYLVKRDAAGGTVVTETVQAAGRTLLNYTARRLTSRTGCTMRNLRRARRLWVCWELDLVIPNWTVGELETVAALTENRLRRPEGPRRDWRHTANHAL